MRKILFTNERYDLTILVPKEIVLFMQAAHVPENEVLDKERWAMNVEDTIFLSHEKHPLDEGYESHGVDGPVSTSRNIWVLIHGLYLHSKKVFELEPTDIISDAPLATSSTNTKDGWRVYVAYYDKEPEVRH